MLSVPRVPFGENNFYYSWLLVVTELVVSGTQCTKFAKVAMRPKEPKEPPVGVVTKTLYYSETDIIQYKVGPNLKDRATSYLQIFIISI